MNIKNTLKSNKVTAPLYTFLKGVKNEYKYKQHVNGHYTFINRSLGKNKLCIVLAGYKPFLYESVFGRIAEYMDDDIDVCILTSGLYSTEIYDICKINNWSYLSTKENNVSLIQNIAIMLHPKAEYIYKLDEDIFITKGYFKKMYDGYKRIEEDGIYNIGILAPVIPINGYGHMKVLEKLGLMGYYKDNFETPKYAAGRDRMIESNPEVAMFLWGGGTEMCLI